MSSALSESRQELLGKLLRGGALPSVRKPGIPRRPAGDDAPVSYGQLLVWLHSQMSTDVQLYNEPVTVHRLGPMNRLALERAFTEIIRRHESWRTTFGWKGGEVVQRIQPAPEHIAIPFNDVSTLPPSEREQAALKLATEDAVAPFDLAVGPMYRPRLIRFSEQEHRLFLALHHIIFDGVSLYRVFLPELCTLYDAYDQGRPSPLPELPLQFADYAVWHRQWVQEISPVQLAYWREKLKGVQRRDILPPDRPRKANQGFHGAMVTLALDMPTSEALKDLSQRSGVTLFMTLLATFLTLIWAYTREDDILSGGTSAGRNRSETDNLMGFFLNTIVLRTDMSGDPTFLEVMRRGREELLSALANDGIPFENLVKELAPHREGTKNAFFQVSFSFEPSLAPLGPNWKFTQMDIETGAAKFELHLELDERHDGIIGRFIYNSELFNHDTIEKMVECWQTIVQQVVATPDLRISRLVPSLEELRKTPAATEPSLPESATSVRSSGLSRLIRKLLSTK